MSTVCVFSLLKLDCQFKFLAMILDFQKKIKLKIYHDVACCALHTCCHILTASRKTQLIFMKRVQ